MTVSSPRLHVAVEGYRSCEKVLIILLVVSLPADYLVWAASPEAAFLKGRLVWANWDVEELMARSKEIEEGDSMTLGMNGYPYMGYTSKSMDAI